MAGMADATPGDANRITALDCRVCLGNVMDVSCCSCLVSAEGAVARDWLYPRGGDGRAEAEHAARRDGRPRRVTGRSTLRDATVARVG